MGSNMEQRIPGLLNKLQILTDLMRRTGPSRPHNTKHGTKKSWIGRSQSAVRDRSLSNLHSNQSQSKQWPGQAGGPSAAVDGEFAAGEGADVEAGFAKSLVGFPVFFQREQALPA
jgi:hypothetical protein